MPTPSPAAKLYETKHPDTPFLVVFRDPTRVEKSGRAKRVQKWFADRSRAEKYQAELNEKLLTEGAAGATFDADKRADAVAARRCLDRHGHMEVALLQLAQRFVAQACNQKAASLRIGEELNAFLLEKEHIDGASEETLKNLKTRLKLWFELAPITTVGDIDRQSVECLRTRMTTRGSGTPHPVSKQTRRNDLNAVSAFCTWLVSCSPPKIEHHPLKGVRRPRVEHGKKETLTVEQCAAGLRAAAAINRLDTLAVMILAGARPSELGETRLIYGRHPLVRIEGGKLKGRANRVVPMNTALRAFLIAAGSPAQVQPLTRHERETVGTAAGFAWKPDICRHTYISNRLQLAQNDALVAREAGTSESVIYRHYHGLKAPTEARKWAALRPDKCLTTPAAAAKIAA